MGDQQGQGVTLELVASDTIEEVFIGFRKDGTDYKLARMEPSVEAVLRPLDTDRVER